MSNKLTYNEYANEGKVILNNKKTPSIFTKITKHKKKKNVDISIFKNNYSSKINYKIDFVFPYVDNLDKEWIKIYNQYSPKKINDDWEQWAIGIQRFRANDMLQYVFRGIEKFLPFINNVYFIVMQDSQVPSWVNRKKVKIVYHKDFIPEEYLPTFNSGTIEMFLHKIPGLSEHFIYGNDDVFFTSPLSINDFYINKVPVFSIKERKRHQNPGDYLRVADKLLVTGNHSKYVEVIQHICIPYIKSTIAEAFNLYKNTLLNNITMFRAKNNYNQWVFTLYQKYYKSFYNIEMPYLCCEIKPESRYKYNVNWKKYKCVCLNDSDKTTEDDLYIVKNKLDAILPNKSKFEN